MTRVLLTGGSGFIGRHVVAELVRRDIDVCCIGRTACEGADFRTVDLLDPWERRDAVAEIGATHLVHLAWYAEPGLYWRSPLNLDWSAATFGLLRNFREAGGTRAVLSGTCAEYAWGSDRFLEDQTPCRPATLYGAAKDATRRLAVAYAHETGLSLAWGRLFFLFGPGEKPGRLVSDAIEVLRTGGIFETSEGRQRRDFMHVADVANAIIEILMSSVEGAVNIGSGQAVSVRSIIDRIGTYFAQTDNIRFGARTLAPSEPTVIEADVHKLHDLVGFRPQYGLEEAIDAVLEASGPRSPIAR